jgi:hypothetical protein
LLKHRYTITENDLAKENCERKKEAGPHWQPTTVSWENHRWLRFRTAMAALQEALERLDETYSAQQGSEPLVVRPHDQPPHDYQWSPAQRSANPAQATAELLQAIRAWHKSTPQMRFDAGTLPAPRPELRMWPRV